VQVGEGQVESDDIDKAAVPNSRDRRRMEFRRCSGEVDAGVLLKSPDKARSSGGGQGKKKKAAARAGVGDTYLYVVEWSSREIEGKTRGDYGQDSSD
jgi:hypothetical protein